jgi:hypothetical protein
MVDTLRSGRVLPRVYIVPLTDGPDAPRILVEGSHRTRSYHEVGQTSLGAVLVETDADIAAVGGRVPAFMNFGCTTVDHVRDRYEDIWRVQLAALGEAGIDALLAAEMVPGDLPGYMTPGPM